MNCTRCKKPLTDNICGTADHPYCPECHLIYFYGYPEEKLKKVMAEIEIYRQRGVDEETLKRLLWSTLVKHADKVIKEKLSKGWESFNRGQP